VPDTTAVVVEATRAEEEFVCALARTISKALETKVVRRRIFGYIW
jgi:hypothetical protein